MYIPGSWTLIFIQKKPIPYRGTIMFLHRSVRHRFLQCCGSEIRDPEKTYSRSWINHFFYLNRFGTGPFSFVYLRTGVQKKPVLDPWIFIYLYKLVRHRSGIRCLFDPWIRDPEKTYSGSRTRIPRICDTEGTCAKRIYIKKNNPTHLYKLLQYCNVWIFINK